jgi:lipid-A-disaccharide synthase
VPTLPALAAELLQATRGWPNPPRVITDPGEKHAVFRLARAALAASGTVTLELALAAVPMVAAYRVAPWEAAIARRLIRVPSAILANLVLGENVVPEFLQGDCVPAKLADALSAIIKATASRCRQLDAFTRLDAVLQIGPVQPSIKAALAVLAAAGVAPVNEEDVGL